MALLVESACVHMGHMTSTMLWNLTDLNLPKRALCFDTLRSHLHSTATTPEDIADQPGLWLSDTILQCYIVGWRDAA
jgi:hypothetical protein